MARRVSRSFDAGFWRYLVLCAVFIASLSCSYSEPAKFWSGTERLSGNKLLALSREADEGILSLSAAGKLEYAFLNPLPIDDGYSLELSYQWNGKAEAHGRAVLELGEFLWELPWDLSFLENAIAPDHAALIPDSVLIHYAVPMPQKSLKEIAIRWHPQNAEAKGFISMGIKFLESKFLKPKSRDYSPSLAIKGISIIPRRFGFSFDKNDSFSLRLSPFAYYDDAVLFIDPPESFLCSQEALLLKPSGPGLTVEAGNAQGDPGYLRVEDGKLEGQLIVYEAFLSSAAYPLRISGADLAEAWLVQAVSPVAGPIPADPGMILPWPQDAWRDSRYELFCWESFPSILIFDFADYGVQDLFLKRLAFFAEKAGFRGRLALDSEIADLHGWNAHDYRAETLAAFFSLARKTSFPLLREEWELETLLLDAGIIRRDSDGSVVPGEGAVISISRESPDYLRSLFMAHEGFHGLYFIDEEFRVFCKSRWEAFPSMPRNFLLSYFGFQAYDTADTDLVINEFMAHLLQQPVSQASRYFGETLAARIDASPWRRTVLPPKDEASNSWPALANAFRAEAEVFSGYVNERWGLAAGRVRAVTVRN